MFNVLPENFKANIRREYNERRVIVWLMACVLLQISALLLFLPSYVVLKFQEKNILAENSGIIKNDPQNNFAQITEVFKATNRELSVLAVTDNPDAASNLVLQLSNIRGSSITFSKISYHYINASSSSVSLSGVALNREALLSLQKKLQSSKLFDQVDLPVSNFAKSTNIEFSLNLVARI